MKQSRSSNLAGAKSLGICVTVVGIIACILGVIFYLQGKSVVGPTSSFMYANPEWTGNGLVIASVGAIVFAIGIFFWLRPAPVNPKFGE